VEDLPEGDYALGWLYGIARWVLANERRCTLRSSGLLSRLRSNNPDPDPTPETVVVRRERDHNNADGFGRLRPEDQELLRLAWWEEPSCTLGATVKLPGRH
jgi:RNA polymerase sigma-70 factor (ECF subfamily)